MKNSCFQLFLQNRQLSLDYKVKGQGAIVHYKSPTSLVYVFTVPDALVLSFIKQCYWKQEHTGPFAHVYPRLRFCAPLLRYPIYELHLLKEV